MWKIIVGFLFVIGGGLFFGLHTLPGFLEIHEFRDYSKTEADVTKLDLIAKPKNTANQPDQYFLETEFSYKVDGIEYRSEAAVPSHHGNREEFFRRIKTKVNEGDPIYAYFDPIDPSRAYLSIETDSFQFFMDFVFSGLAVAAGGFVMFAGIQEIRNSHN